MPAGQLAVLLDNCYSEDKATLPDSLMKALLLTDLCEGQDVYCMRTGFLLQLLPVAGVFDPQRW